MRKSLLLVGSLLGAWGFLASAGPLSFDPIKDRSRGSVDLLANSEEDADLAVEIRTARTLTPRDMTLLASYSFKLAPGLYKANQARIGGRTYVLVPVDRYRGRARTPETASPGTFSCNGPYFTNIAVDPVAKTVVDTLAEYAGGCSGGGGVTRWGPRFTTDAPIEAERRSRIVQENAARQHATLRAEQSAAAVQRARAKDVADRPKKMEVGARLCRERSGYVETAFTESVSPNGKKVQLRIADLSYRGEGQMRPGGWTPSIIWDVPENWRLCE